jgi:hypothetical protein
VRCKARARRFVRQPNQSRTTGNGGQQIEHQKRLARTGRAEGNAAMPSIGSTPRTRHRRRSLGEVGRGQQLEALRDLLDALQQRTHGGESFGLVQVVQIEV